MPRLQYTTYHPYSWRRGFQPRHGYSHPFPTFDAAGCRVSNTPLTAPTPEDAASSRVMAIRTPSPHLTRQDAASPMPHLPPLRLETRLPAASNIAHLDMIYYAYVYNRPNHASRRHRKASLLFPSHGDHAICIRKPTALGADGEDSVRHVQACGLASSRKAF